MMEPPVEDLLDRVDSKFTLVSLAALRGRQINSYFNQLGEGLGTIVPPQVTSVSRKPLSISLEEIAAGKITYARTEGERQDDDVNDQTGDVVQEVAAAPQVVTEEVAAAPAALIPEDDAAELQSDLDTELQPGLEPDGTQDVPVEAETPELEVEARGEPEPDLDGQEQEPEAGLQEIPQHPEAAVEHRPEAAVEHQPEAAVEHQEVGLEYQPGVGLEYRPEAAVEHQEVGLEHRPEVGLEHRPEVGLEHQPEVGLEQPETAEPPPAGPVSDQALTPVTSPPVGHLATGVAEGEGPAGGASASSAGAFGSHHGPSAVDSAGPAATPPEADQ
jgi:DNA-directed RNA polymerase subunit omega